MHTLKSLLLSLVFFAVLLPAQAQSNRYATAATQQVVERMIEAHGGMDTWQAKHSFYVERVHHNIYGTERTFHFTISADMASERMYQVWAEGLSNKEAPGILAWDGEHAWSTNYQTRIPARFIMSSGFYLANTPWLTQQPNVFIEAPQHTTGMYEGDSKTYLTLKMHYEPRVVAKPKGIKDIPRDYFTLYLNPDTYVLVGVNMYRSYAGMLDALNLPTSLEGVEHIFLVKEHIEADGLLMPSTYDVYDPSGVKTADGVFENWVFDRPFDASLVVMPADAHLDTSSSYLRANTN